MLKAFQAHIDKNFPELQQESFLVAVSGGVDSIVLADLCRLAQLKFGIAHVNFKLRGAASDADAEFVAELAKNWGVAYYTTSFDTAVLKTARKSSTQELARDLRYNWFEELITDTDYSYMLTAHHADDDLETFLLNLSRGTGLKGLSGIPERRARMRRPLLNFSKAEILAYAQKEGLSWREDASNATDSYQRNAFRLQVLPKLKEVAPDILPAFLKTRAHLRSTTNILNKYIQHIKKQVFKDKGIYLELKFSDLEPYGSWKDLAHPLLTEFGFTDWDTIQGLESASSGTIIRSESHELLKDRATLILRPVGSEVLATSDGLQLKVEQVQSIQATNPRTLYIDKESLKHRLNVRKWKKGDYFYPLGMGGRKKKLAKFYKDIKLDVFAKEAQWLLCDGDEIVWVIGHRADERYKVRPDSASVLKITWTD